MNEHERAQTVDLRGRQRLNRLPKRTYRFI